MRSTTSASPRRCQMLLNRADSKVGLDPSDAEDVMGMRIACSIPSSRSIPLSLNLGNPVVTSEPRSAVAKQLQELASAVLSGDQREDEEGVVAMSVSERINQAQRAARERGDASTPWASATSAPLAADGLAEFKAKVHEALFERLGMRLFEATSEEKMQALVIAEIASLMDANDSALSAQERQRLVRDIARDVMGLGPIEQFLEDPTVTEVMVNGDDNIYVERAASSSAPACTSCPRSICVVSSTASSPRSVVGSTSRHRWSMPASPTGRASTSSCPRCRSTDRS